MGFLEDGLGDWIVFFRFTCFVCFFSTSRSFCRSVTIGSGRGRNLYFVGGWVLVISGRFSKGFGRIRFEWLLR